MKKKTASNNTLLARWEKYEVLVISLVSRLALCVRKTALTWKPQTWRLSNYDFVRELKFCSVKTIIFSLSFSKNWHTDSELCFGGNDFYIWQKQNFIFRKNCSIANVFQRAKQSNHKFDWNTTTLEEGLETQINKKLGLPFYHQKLQMWSAAQLRWTHFMLQIHERPQDWLISKLGFLVTIKWYMYASYLPHLR